MTDTASDKSPFLSDSANRNSSFFSSPLVPWHWGWSAVIAALTLITLAFRYALPIRDGDLWFHMLYGKYFLEHKTLIADHTIFSWTPTTNDTIYCTWLPDIFLYLLHKLAGLPGIFAFRYMCLLVLVLACFLYARKLKIMAHPLVWFMCLLGVIMSYTAAFEKPEILSFVFMIMLVWNWWHIRSSDEAAWMYCYLFPAIMLIWVNSHGGFVFGAIFLLLVGFGEILNTWLSPQNILPARIRKHLIMALLIAAVMPFLTPYGYHYPAQLFLDLLPTPENIAYNNKVAAYSSPFDFADNYLFAMCANIAIVLLLILYLRNFKKVEWSSLLANLFFAFLYTRFFRTTFYWVPVFLFSSIQLLSMTPLFPFWGKYPRKIYSLFPFLILVASVWLAGEALYNSATRPEAYQWMGFGISDGNPVAEAQYIKKYFPKSRIANTYDQGAYLLWEIWPENTVFFDARHFPYRNWSDEFFDLNAGNNISEMTKKYPCDLWCIRLSNIHLLFSLMQTGNWKLAFYGRNAAVLVRSDIPLPQNAPRRSVDIFDLKSLYGASICFTFTCYIKDWQTAEKLLKAMKATFTHKPAQPSLNWATHYFNGLTAFHARDYHTAISQFEAINHSTTYIRFTLTSCYLYLAREAWQKKEGNLALQYIQKSKALIPDDIYSAYNLGVINWQQEQSMENSDKKKEWRKHLEYFVRHAPIDSEFESFRVTAKAILDGSFEKYPILIIPPEPFDRKVLVNQREIDTLSQSRGPRNSPRTNTE